MATFDEIRRANAAIRPTDIKGKEYAEVNQRVKAFRMLYPDGAIVTTLLSNEGEPGKRTCVFRAEVFDGGGKLLATGTAYETEGSSNINRTSFIENGETSSVGRALGFLGLGIDTSIASAEEVGTAMLQQAEFDASSGAASRKAVTIAPENARALEAEIVRMNINGPRLLARYGVQNCSELNVDQYCEIREMINKAKKNGRKG